MTAYGSDTTRAVLLAHPAGGPDAPPAVVPVETVPPAGGTALPKPEAEMALPDVLDFSDNTNPLGPPTGVAEIGALGLSDMGRYPDAEKTALRRQLAETHGLAPESLLPGAGATELIYLIPRVLGLRRALALAPCNRHFWRASELAGMDVEGMMASAESGFVPDLAALRDRLGGVGLVWLATPNDATGMALDREAVLTIARDATNVIVVVNETYIEFLPDWSERTLLCGDMPANLIVLRSFSKFYAMPGVRLGFLGARADMVRRLEHGMVPWSVNCFAAAAPALLCADASHGERTRALIVQEREFLSRRVGEIPGLHAYPGVANFILVRADPRRVAPAQLKAHLHEQRIRVRDGATFRGLDGSYFRVAVRTHPENERLIAALHAAMSSRA